MSIEAMKQAFDDYMCYGGADKHEKLMQVVNDYIAEAEKQKPVAWIEHEWSGSGLRHLHFERREQSLRDEVVNPIWTPLYTHPQPKRKPLTIEQLREHWQVAKVLDMTDAEIDFADYVLIARDVEALYGITSDMKQEPVDKTAKQRHEWVGLTDEEIWASDEIMEANSGYGANFETLRKLTKAIEAKLKEKNT